MDFKIIGTPVPAYLGPLRIMRYVPQGPPKGQLQGPSLPFLPTAHLTTARVRGLGPGCPRQAAGMGVRGQRDTYLGTLQEFLSPL